MRPSRRVVLVEGFFEAIATIAGNPLRASLAAIAMAVAVATTAIVQTGLSGLAESAQRASARAFGSDSFLVTRIAAGTLSRREIADRLARNPNITRGDVRFLDRVSGDRVNYAATSLRAADVIAGSRKFESASVNGTQASLAQIRDLGIERGRFITADEEVRSAPVVVVGKAVTDELFPAVDALGAQVRIAGRAFTIIGVQAPQGTGASVSLDRYVWMPLTAYERAFGAPDSVQVYAKAAEGVGTAAAEDIARAAMRARRHLAPGAPDTFDIITPEASRSFVSRITERIGAAGPPISLMALFAAIVVVANTTLVSVTQRTREIGVRRALGAARANIITETLAEASVIALIGGSLGLAIAAAVLKPVSGMAGLPLTIGWPTALASLAAAGVSGVAAGWYPARRSVAVDVNTALRSE
jgi:putative ABC transport system permease protein